MCTLFIAKNHHPEYKLLIAANRDEFYSRPTRFAHWWEDHPDILGGRDLKEGGSWFAIHRNGRFATLTNYREITRFRADAPSRGQLVKDFVAGRSSPASYLQHLRETGDQYNGFNLLFGYADELYYYANRTEDYGRLPDGLYGLSNHLLDTQWPKVREGKIAFGHMLNGGGRPEDNRVFELLYDRKTYPDEELPDTGVGLERERMLSALFIESPVYGTRASWYLKIDRHNEVELLERSYIPEGEHQFHFSIGSNKRMANS